MERYRVSTKGSTWVFASVQVVLVLGSCSTVQAVAIGTTLQGSSTQLHQPPRWPAGRVAFQSSQQHPPRRCYCMQACYTTQPQYSQSDSVMTCAARTQPMLGPIDPLASMVVRPPCAAQDFMSCHTLVCSQTHCKVHGRQARTKPPRACLHCCCLF